ncbi:MAG: hypothetical protein KJ985_15635, partial [Proteobacteria bacterium]|nr:hypothetical protein [Pseudomonadota bacterium]
SHDIDARLQQGLDKRGYSFARWCVGWGFDPVEAALTLKEKPADGVSSALDAVRRDLPEIYFEIFEGRHPVQKTWQEKKVYPRLSLNIAWDEVRRGYVAMFFGPGVSLRIFQSRFQEDHASRHQERNSLHPQASL